MPAKAKTAAPVDPTAAEESSNGHLQQQKVDFPVGSTHPILGRVITGHSAEGICLFENEEENFDQQFHNMIFA
jgi:hypothetical protein